MSKIYTKLGDFGQTSLIGGTKVSKADSRLELYGSIDELNSYIGLIISYLGLDFFEQITLLKNIQGEMFKLGSNLACEISFREKYKLPIVEDRIINEIEKAIDEIDKDLDPIHHFILPGGHLIASQIHVVRCFCRRVERELVKYQFEMKEELPKNAIQLLNRLSDYFFQLSRFVNQKNGILETIWKK